MQTEILSQTEAQKILDTFLPKAEEVRTTRENSFDKFERFVLDGAQWDKDEEPEGNRPKLSFNQTEDFIRIFKAKLFPRNSQTGTLEIGVKVFEKNKDNKEKFESEILQTYDREKLSRTLLEQSDNFFIGGSACLYYPKDPITKKAKIISIDPRTVYLGWNGDKLEQFAFTDEISTQDVANVEKKGWLMRFIEAAISDLQKESKKFKKVERVTYWDKDVQIVKIGSNLKIFKNEDGIIPFSWIPNEPKPHRHEGRSEARSVMHLDKEFNFRASDFGQRVRENTQPNLALFTEQDTDNLTRDERGILPLGKDDDAKFLGLPENQEVLNYLNMISDRMGQKMAINEAVQGKVKSNVSSLSMTYYFSPLLDRISLKRVYWDEAFKELNNAILTYAFGVSEYRTRPVFESVLISDEETKINNTIRLLQNRLISHRDAIDEIRGIENSEEKFAEIVAEYKELEKVSGFLNIKISATPALPVAE